MYTNPHLTAKNTDTHLHGLQPHWTVCSHFKQKDADMIASQPTGQVQLSPRRLHDHIKETFFLLFKPISQADRSNDIQRMVLKYIICILGPVCVSFSHGKMKTLPPVGVFPFFIYFLNYHQGDFITFMQNIIGLIKHFLIRFPYINLLNDKLPIVFSKPISHVFSSNKQILPNPVVQFLNILYIAVHYYVITIF